MRRGLLALGAVALVAGCSTVEVNYDYDKEADFSKYKSYAWMPPPPQGRPSSDLVSERIERAVTNELGAKGFREDANAPDLLVLYHVGTKDKIQVTDWGYSYGSYYWGMGGRSVDVYEYEEGTLIVDLVDAGTKQLAWRGWGTTTIDRTKPPDQITAMVNDVVAAIMKKYPPPTK